MYKIDSMKIIYKRLPTDFKYTSMMYRRKCLKRLALLTFAFCASAYITVLICGDMSAPRALGLTALDRCPACYGISVCPELYSGQIHLEAHSLASILFNTKNLYYGYTKTGRRVILKKLAHTSELKDFDKKLCTYWGLRPGCKPLDIVETNIYEINDKLIQLVQFNSSSSLKTPRKGLVLCPYPDTVSDLVHPLTTAGGTNKHDWVHIWTMLSLNPEPIILQILPKSKGYPVPAYGGVCGRLELVAYEGEPLSSLMHVEWHRKLKYAIQILSAAMTFTYKHERYRFYLMDWSLDNIVANQHDVISFIDLEDIIVVDKRANANSHIPTWYKQYTQEYVGTEFAFSIDKICKHHLSDHNVWAACYVIAGPDNPLLYPIPSHLESKLLENMLSDCLVGTKRFETVTKLKVHMNKMLKDEQTVGYGY